MLSRRALITFLPLVILLLLSAAFVAHAINRAEEIIIFSRQSSASGSSGSACADSVPAIASAVGLTTCAFSDPMTGSATVDTLGGNAAVFNWYPEDLFCYVAFTGSASTTVLTVSSIDAQFGGCAGTLPALGNPPVMTQNMVIGGGGNNTPPSPGTILGSGITGSGLTGTYNITGNSVTVSAGTHMIASYAQPASTFSFNSSSGMEMSNVSQGRNNNSIGSATFLTSPTVGAAGLYHGTVFKGTAGFYSRVYFTFDKTKSNGGCTDGAQNCRWPAIWGANLFGLTSTEIQLENDFLDMLLVPAGSNYVQLLPHIHEFNTGVGGGELDSGIAFSSLAQLCNPALNGTDYHQIDALWVPTTNGFLGGMGLWKWFFDVDTCAGAFGIAQGSMSGTTTLNITEITAGSLAVNSFLECNGCTTTGSTILQITACPGGNCSALGNYTVSATATFGAGTNIIAGNMQGCPYFTNANTPCPLASGTNFSGAFSSLESHSDGMALLFASGCTALEVASPAGAECSGATGSWPMFLRRQQVWCASAACKTVH